MSLKKGLTAYQLKIIAAIFMTIDHIQRTLEHTRAFDLWKLSGYMWQFGRIAAPLFCFLVAEGARHTHDRVRYIRRLYLAGLFTGIGTSIIDIPMIKLFGIGFGSLGGMFYTFFFTVLHIHLIEGMIRSAKAREGRKFAKNLLLFLLSFLPTLLYVGEPSVFSLLRNFFCPVFSDTFTALSVYTGVFETLFPSPILVEYSYFFVLMGVCMYFAGEKYRMCGVFVGFCALCYLTARFNIGLFQEFYGIGDQHYMILALPFMLFYNGARGKSHKYFFYIYYPVHYLILTIISASLNKFFT